MSAHARRFPWSRVRRSEAFPLASRRLRRVARRSTRPCRHACSNPRFRSTTAQPSRHFLLLALLMSDCRFALLQDGLATRVKHNFAHRESGNNSGIYPNSLAMAQIDLYVSRRSHSRYYIIDIVIILLVAHLTECTNSNRNLSHPAGRKIVFRCQGALPSEKWASAHF